MSDTAPFFLLTIGAAWVLWIPLMMWLRSRGRLGAGGVEEPLRDVPLVVGVSWFAGASTPTLVALWLTHRSSGTAGMADLAGRLLEFDVGITWHVVALAGPVAVGLVAIAAYAMQGGAGVRLQPSRLPLIPVALIAAIPFGPLGEELGWRGYALPRLIDAEGAVTAAIIVGLVWTVWHVPLWWAPLGTSVSGSRVTLNAVGRFTVEIMAISVIMTWLFVETGGSLWIAVAFHASWNADLHRFLFERFNDELATRIGARVVAVMAVVAMALLLVPGLTWRQ